MSDNDDDKDTLVRSEGFVHRLNTGIRQSVDIGRTQSLNRKSTVLLMDLKDDYKKGYFHCSIVLVSRPVHPCPTKWWVCRPDILRPESAPDLSDTCFSGAQ